MVFQHDDFTFLLGFGTINLTHSSIHHNDQKHTHIDGVQSAGGLDIHFTARTSWGSAALLAEKNSAARHHVLRSLITLQRHFSRQVAQLFRKKFRR
jgi:hypothetical protein